MGGHTARLNGCTLPIMTATKKRPRGRPPTGQTPKRYIRAGDIWDRLSELAHERGETMTALVHRALENEEYRLLREQREVQ